MAGDFSELKRIQEKKRADALSDKRHSQLLLDNTSTQEVFVKSIAKLVDFLDQKTTRTEVVNQLRSIGTPDVQKVVAAVDSLHGTLKTHENTDLSEVTKVLTELLVEAKALPKKLPTPEKQQFVDYTKQLAGLEKTIKAVEAAVKAQKLNVEAPVVNVEPVVNVDAPDLAPIQKSVDKGSQDVVKAVKAIKMPSLDTDPIEKLLKKTNKLLEELPENMPTSSGGGGSSWVATNTEGIPVPIELTGSGAVATESPAQASRLDDAADPIIYIGKAVVGADEADPVWQIAKLDTSSGLIKTWASAASFTQVWDDRAGLTYQ